MNKEVHAKINGIIFKIQMVDSRNENLLIRDSFRAGVTHTRTAEIYISDDLHPEITKRVLLHEITHAYIYTGGMGQVNWEEENVADFIENNMEEIYWTWEKVLKALEEQNKGEKHDKITK